MMPSSRSSRGSSAHTARVTHRHLVRPSVARAPRVHASATHRPGGCAKGSSLCPRGKRPRVRDGHRSRPLRRLSCDRHAHFAAVLDSALKTPPQQAPPEAVTHAHAGPWVVSRQMVEIRPRSFPSSSALSAWTVTRPWTERASVHRRLENPEERVSHTAHPASSRPSRNRGQQVLRRRREGWRSQLLH
jgi:hypothetical protein